MRRLLGVSAAALALSVAGSTAAYACEGGKGWDKGTPSGYKPGNGGGTKTSTDKCEFSVDGTAWYSSVKVDNVTLTPGDDGKVHVQVRTASDSASCTASLASYRTHGSTWETSGKQVFHDWDTVSVKAGQTDTLDVAFPDVSCFAQIDLYYGNTKYDGNYNANDGYTHGDLPEGPNHAVIGDKKIAWWNGGTKDCTTQVVPSDSPTPTPTPSSVESTPATSESATPSPSESSASASASESTTSASASASESTTTTAGDLAETGSNGTGVIAGGAALLLVAGGGVLFATRRRQAARRH
jgi:LPXTG-motif cell wall-anchored protein